MSLLGLLPWLRRLLGGTWRKGDQVEDHGYRAGYVSQRWLDQNKAQEDNRERRGHDTTRP